MAAKGDEARQERLTSIASKLIALVEAYDQATRWVGPSRLCTLTAATM